MAVFFIHNPLNHSIRIGKSKQVKNLLNNLRMNSGIDMELLGVIADENELIRLCTQFSANHLKGEWYTLTDEMEVFINDNAVDPVTLESPWSSIRVPQILYNKLVVHREETAVPVATAARIAIEAYLKSERQKQEWLDQMEENQDDRNNGPDKHS